MCLYSLSRFPKFTFKPIRVYKVVTIDTYSNSVYTPFKKYKLKRKNVTKSFIQILYGIFINLLKHPKQTPIYEIKEGYFHSYNDSLGSVKSLEYIGNLCKRDILYNGCVITEAYIPRFSFYYTDSFGGPTKEICSNKLNIGNKFWYKKYMGWGEVPCSIFDALKKFRGGILAQYIEL